MAAAQAAAAPACSQAAVGRPCGCAPPCPRTRLSSLPCPTPCICTRNSVLMRRAASLSPSPRVLHSASICAPRARLVCEGGGDTEAASHPYRGAAAPPQRLLLPPTSSMKMMVGLFSRASANRLLTSFSDSPSHLRHRGAGARQRWRRRHAAADAAVAGLQSGAAVAQQCCKCALGHQVGGGDGEESGVGLRGHRLRDRRVQRRRVAELSRMLNPCCTAAHFSHPRPWVCCSTSPLHSSPFPCPPHHAPWPGTTCRYRGGRTAGCRSTAYACL